MTHMIANYYTYYGKKQWWSKSSKIRLENKNYAES